MPSSTLHRGSSDWGWRLAALWVGLLAGPVVWAALLQTNYTMSYVACEQGSNWMLHVATVVALVLIAGAAWLAWNAKPPGFDDSHPSIEPATTGIQRARFMAIGGVALCAWFALVVLALEVPALMLTPCNP